MAAVFLGRINDLARGACGVRFPKSSVQKGSERHWLLPKTNNQKKRKTKKKVTREVCPGY